METVSSNRPLTDEERQLVRWMLEHGEPDARNFLDQLEHAEITPYRCPCGCASLHFSVPGHPEPSGGLHPIADFVFGSGDNMSGIFIYERSGILSGLEVYGLSGDAAKALPSTDSLRTFADASQNV
jgi:hypothetical protein